MPSSTISSNSAPFIFNTAIQSTAALQSNSISANITSGNGTRNLSNEVSSLLVNKMDVEDPFALAETFNNVTSQSGKLDFIKLVNIHKDYQIFLT